jgi:hypothetical protein
LAFAFGEFFVYWGIFRNSLLAYLNKAIFKPMIYRLLQAVFFICFLATCKQKTSKEVIPAFYFWKSNFRLTEVEKKAFTNNQIQKLYVKFFDVSWNILKRHPQLDAPIRFSEKLPASCLIIPVVFITNQTLVNLPVAEIEPFAKGIFTEILTLLPQNSPLSEIQIDCDWTHSTKHKYFKLLKTLKKNNVKLSATIRLHQVKFFEKTGVPPVDRGMLMCYNMSDWRKYNSQNSIFSPNTLNQYIQDLEDYPMSLDVVMPIFHWTIIYRNEQFLYFVNNLSADSLKTNAIFLQLIGKQEFVVQKDANFQRISIRKGDVFKCENAPYEDILKGSRIVLEKISTQKLTFALYHLDEKSLSNYSHEQIQQLFHINKTLL